MSTLERKTVNVMSDVKDDLVKLKSSLGLSNESDTIRFLLTLYNTSATIPTEAVTALLELRK
ncbi:hypothetical protein J31TS4_19080 [Paenibacillus sp. J31TS4]|nr:hypothetical protein J31TS4_19080 [Paenibacillus sp. J31TS4]